MKRLLFVCLLLLLTAPAWAQSQVTSSPAPANAGAVELSGSKNLTEGAATGFLRFALPVSTVAAVNLWYVTYATDGTDFQLDHGRATINMRNKGGTETPNLDPADSTRNQVSSGTLSCTPALDASGTNQVDVTMNCTSSLTQTTLAVYWELRILYASTGVAASGL